MFRSLSALSYLVLLPLFVSATVAHFTLEYPYTRGFDEDKESQAPCGSFNTANATLTPWYAANGPVEIDSHHDTATVQVFVSYDSNPTVQTYNQNNLTDALKIAGEGEFCFKVNATTPTQGANTTAVIIVEYISAHGRLYQCSDVSFSNDASLGSNITCTGSLTAATASTSDSHTHTSQQNGARSSQTSSMIVVASIACLLVSALAFSL